MGFPSFGTGGSEDVVPKEWMHAELTSDHTVVNGTLMPFDKVISSSGAKITVDANGRFTLKAGSKYKLTAFPVAVSNNASAVYFWREDPDGTDTEIGNRGTCGDLASAPGFGSPCVAFVDLAVDTEYEVESTGEIGSCIVAESFSTVYVVEM